MKKNPLLMFIQVVCLISIFCSVSGCLEGDAVHEENPDAFLAKDEEGSAAVQLRGDSGNSELNDNSGEDNSGDDSPAGTCPFGNHCSCPGCSLWLDADNDGYCDRG